MNKKILAIATLISLTAPQMQGGNELTDSTDMYTYSTADGESGLRVAIKGNQDNWKPIKDLRLTGSDFGAWGSGKKIYNPRLTYDKSSEMWYLVFDVDKEGTVVGYTNSPDLINWAVQEYCYTDDVVTKVPEMTTETTSEHIDGKEVNGTINRVPTEFIDKLKAYQHYRKGLEAKYAEQASGDQWRFAGIDTVRMTLTLDSESPKAISDRLFGIFFEDINYAADGGLYAELIQNRDFEYTPSDRGNDEKWNSTKGWTVSNANKGILTIETENPIHVNNRHHAVLEVNKTGVALVNGGFDGITVKKGELYNVSLWVKSAKGCRYEIELFTNDGKKIGGTKLTYKGNGNWEQLKGKIKVAADCADAKMAITPLRVGSHSIDMVSLMPAATFKGRENGLRADLAQTLADLKPRFVRFPGGCVAHGDGIDNMYDWKGSIGALEERTGKRNLWGYHQTRGLGYHEYFLFCEDIGASPLPVVAAGVPCQNSSTHSHYSHDMLTGNGQQCGIPMEDMPTYIEDILDLIEYANGDVTTPWGAKRAEAGHPEPFNLKMIGIGNEDLISEVFKERFLMIYNAIVEKYPEIEVIGTVGPFYEGSDYDTGWAFAREHHIPVVDEHYYVSPGWLIHNGNYYDSYPRGANATKVYLGEYASHEPDRSSDIEAALTDALYLTNVERNADIVTMTSYAPLLAKKGHTQWRPDLIYFDNETITLTPDYYVQKMFGNNTGTIYIPSSRSVSINNPDLDCRLGQSIVEDEETGDTIIKLVNMTPVVVETKLPLNGTAHITRLTGLPHDTEAAEETGEIKIADGQFTQLPYSFTVLRFHTRL